VARSAFGELIEQRCAVLAIASQVELGKLLARRGVVVSANTLSAWHTGAKRPRPGRLAILFDVLELHGPDRDRAYRLAHETEVADEPAVDVDTFHTLLPTGSDPR
jgi:hypothetical protein